MLSGPFRNALIVLLEANINVLTQTNVVSPVGILQDVNLVAFSDSHKITALGYRET